MKLLLASVGFALLTSGSAVTAQDAATSAAVHAPAVPASAASVRPPEERLSLARRLLVIVDPPETGLQNMRDLTAQLFASAPIDDADETDRAGAQQLFDRVLVKAAPIVREHLMSIREVTAFVYAREFSSAELQGMIAFAQTPTGKHYFTREHFIDLDPAILVQQQMLQEALLPVFTDVNKEMCQQRTAQRIAAGDKKAKCPLNQPESARG